MTGRDRGPVLAGVDVGSTHCKAVLCTSDGTVLASAERRTPARGPLHDVDLLCRAALGALADCRAAAGRDPDAVGVTGMAETGAPLDAAGDALAPALSWSDPRPARHAALLRDALGAAALHATTGVLPSAKVPLARWLWLRAEHPEALRRMRTWAGAADLVAHALTGTVATDATFAQRTMAWDVHAGAWDADLLGVAGLDADLMPPVRGPGEPVARMPGSGAPVVVAGHDHLVGAWAAGVRTAGQVADSMGTAEALLTLGEGPPDVLAAGCEGMSYGRFVDHGPGRPAPGGAPGRAAGHWCVVAGMSSSGALVEWFCDRLLGLAGVDSGERYRRFAELVAGAADRPTGLVVEPYLHGRSAPRPDLARRLAVHGVGVGHGLPELARAVLEGAACQARWMAEVQGELTGAAPSTVTLLGGAVRQRTWTAIKAAVSPWPTVVCAEPNAPCLGAAAWAGAALGLDPAALTCRLRRVPVPSAAGAYRAFHRDAFLPAARAVRDAPAGPAKATGPEAAGARGTGTGPAGGTGTGGAAGNGGTGPGGGAESSGRVPPHPDHGTGGDHAHGTGKEDPP